MVRKVLSAGYSLQFYLQGLGVHGGGHGEAALRSLCRPWSGGLPDLRLLPGGARDNHPGKLCLECRLLESEAENFGSQVTFCEILIHNEVLDYEV